MNDYDELSEIRDIIASRLIKRVYANTCKHTSRVSSLNKNKSANSVNYEHVYSAAAEYVDYRYNSRSGRILGYNVAVPCSHIGRKYYRKYFSIAKYGNDACLKAYEYAEKHRKIMNRDILRYYTTNVSRACTIKELSIGKGFYISVMDRGGFVEPKIRVLCKGYHKEYCAISNYTKNIQVAITKYVELVLPKNIEPVEAEMFIKEIVANIPSIELINKHITRLGRKLNKRIRLIKM